MRFLFSLLGLCGGLLAAERPNVLWITAEDMSPLLGCYGDKFAVTPNIDRLAKEEEERKKAAEAAAKKGVKRKSVGLSRPPGGKNKRACINTKNQPNISSFFKDKPAEPQRRGLVSKLADDDD